MRKKMRACKRRWLMTMLRRGTKSWVEPNRTWNAFWVAALDAKRRFWGDAVATQGAAWTKLGLSVDLSVLAAACDWVMAQADAVLQAVTTEADSLLKASASEGIPAARGRRAGQAVRSVLDTLGMTREAVAWTGASTSEYAALSISLFRAAAAAITLLVRQYDGYIGQQGRSQVVAHFELVLKVVDATKTCVMWATLGASGGGGGGGGMGDAASTGELGGG